MSRSEGPPTTPPRRNQNNNHNPPPVVRRRYTRQNGNRTLDTNVARNLAATFPGIASTIENNTIDQVMTAFESLLADKVRAAIADAIAEYQADPECKITYESLEDAAAFLCISVHSKDNEEWVNNLIRNLGAEHVQSEAMPQDLTFHAFLCKKNNAKEEYLVNINYSDPFTRGKIITLHEITLTKEELNAFMSKYNILPKDDSGDKDPLAPSLKRHQQGS